MPPCGFGVSGASETQFLPPEGEKASGNKRKPSSQMNNE